LNTAEQRADDGGETNHAAKYALKAAALGGRDHVGDGRHGDHQQAAAAETLEGAQYDQLGHVLRNPA
jgi:hypothetical protein